MDFKQYNEIVEKTVAIRQEELRQQRLANHEEFQLLSKQKGELVSRMRQLTCLSHKLQSCRFPFPDYTDQFGYDCGQKSILNPDRLKVGLTEDGSNFRVIVPSKDGNTEVLIAENAPFSLTDETLIGLRQFVKDFPAFERAFYDWVEHLSYDLSKKVSSWIDPSRSEEFYSFVKNRPFYEIKVTPSGQKSFHPTFMFIDGVDGDNEIITYYEGEELSLPAKITDSSFANKCLAFVDTTSMGNQTLFTETTMPEGIAQDKFEEWLPHVVPLSLSELTENTPPGLYLSVSQEELEKFLAQAQTQSHTM